ncbi:MAG: NAD(P)/FAD-dependent oxidoreductase [Leeuwenhoekiella sp.]
MDKKDYKIHIVGAGISGLIAAQVLEKNGYHPIILEASNRVGGRVKTDVFSGYQLDHGFQVLLDAYPKAQEYLNYDELQLQRFSPGAILFNDGKPSTLGDFTRDFSLALKTMTNGLIGFKDKMKVLKLSASIRSKSLEAIFKEPETTSLAYLKDHGFSDRIINNFFKPFFAGIFLEPKLETSSRMFQFVFKMFGEGYATLPKAGIEAIPKQLKQRLEHTGFRFNSEVKQVQDGKITLSNGEELKSHMTIIAAEASALISNLNHQRIPWIPCDCLYFTVEEKFTEKPIIGLLTDPTTLINNIVHPGNMEQGTIGDKPLLSVTVVKDHNLVELELVSKVQEELAKHCGITNTTFLKRYRIPKALPEITNLQYHISPTETRLTSTIFLAGDQLLNGSLNAAITSGEAAAKGIIETLEGGVVAG